VTAPAGACFLCVFVAIISCLISCSTFSRNLVAEALVTGLLPVVHCLVSLGQCKFRNRIALSVRILHFRHVVPPVVSSQIRAVRKYLYWRVCFGIFNVCLNALHTAGPKPPFRLLRNGPAPRALGRRCLCLSKRILVLISRSAFMCVFPHLLVFFEARGFHAVGGFSSRVIDI